MRTGPIAGLPRRAGGDLGADGPSSRTACSGARAALRRRARRPASGKRVEAYRAIN